MDDSDLKKEFIPILLSLALSSMGMMSFQINLTRLFSITQFYHFAFFIVSLALLGYGASGTFLAIFPRIGHPSPLQTLGVINLLQAIATLSSYLLINHIPFDTFTIAWDFKQVLLLVFHWISLSSVFFFNGLGVGFILTIYPRRTGITYASNLIGTAIGCLLILSVLPILGGEGIILTACLIAALGSLVCFLAEEKFQKRILRESGKFTRLLALFSLIVFAFSTINIIAYTINNSWMSILKLRLSPYKSLSYALQYPGAEIIYQKWNAYARTDVVKSLGIRSLPGLSFTFKGNLPTQNGLFIDGDDLNPIVLPDAYTEFVNFLPTSIAYDLHPNANALILEPRGGLDLMVAFVKGAQSVTAVEVNPDIVEAARHIYQHPKAVVINETDRSFLKRTKDQYDIIQLSLINSYHPVTSGAYSLGEDYRYTVEAFSDIYNHLKPDGIFIVMRWLQRPPSECLKTFATAITAIEKMGGNPSQQIIAIRSYNAITIFVKKSPFKPNELKSIREFAKNLSYDLVYAPDIKENETNIFNILPESIYYKEFMTLLSSPSREDYYRQYPYNVRPATDNFPFFSHYFKLEQTPQILANLGKTWQPFGGAGFYFLFGILLLSILLSISIVLIPLWLSIKPKLKKDQNQNGKTTQIFPYTYFSLLGFAFLFIEIPFLQMFILYLGQPSYAMTGVIFSLLFFSGIGSRFSKAKYVKFVLPSLVLLQLCMFFFLPLFFDWTIGLPFPTRLALSCAILSPLGFLMGIPFPSGLQLHQELNKKFLIPWAWGINGASSVVASILAAILAFSIGLRGVALIGSICYAIAWFVSLPFWIKGLSVRHSQ